MADEKTKAVKLQEKPEDTAILGQSVLDTAQAIIDKSANGALRANDAQPNDMLDGAGVADNFKGLPMRELIAAPLLAAAEAQEKLAAITWDYYQKIAYETDTKGDPTGNTRLLKFDLERPVEKAGVMDKMKVQVQAPFIGLVPIPALLIDSIDIDFQMEVKDTNTTKSEVASETSAKISGGWFGIKAEVTGKVTTSRENTRTTDQTAKYQVNVKAKQQPPTEGLSKLMDIMASCIEPIPVSQ